jgi:hypothetical protein
VETADADLVFQQLDSQMALFEKEAPGNSATNFSYKDPIDGSESLN